MDSRGKKQLGKSYETVDEYVKRGKAEILSGSTGEVQRRIRINYTKNSSVSFSEGAVDNTEGYNAYVAFAMMLRFINILICFKKNQMYFYLSKYFEIPIIILENLNGQRNFNIRDN